LSQLEARCRLKVIADILALIAEVCKVPTADVEQRLNGSRWQLVAEFVEVESGKRAKRPQLDAALTACKKQKAKLVVAKLDRLSRNVAFLLKLIDSGFIGIGSDNLKFGIGSNNLGAELIESSLF
jgi:hypothetical protein